MADDRGLWRAVDGDTVDQERSDSPLTRFRLRQYDAHELGDPGGERAKQYLEDNLGRLDVVPGIAGSRRPDLPDRGLADGFTHDGEPIGDAMIRGGFAVPTRSSTQSGLDAARTQVMRGFGRGWMYESAAAAHNREMLAREREGRFIGNIADKMGEVARPTSGAVGKGWQRGLQQVKGSGGALLHLGGEVFDSDWAKEVGLDIFEEATAEAGLYAADVGSHTNVKDVDDGLTFVAETIGEQMPNLLMMVGTAGLTGLSARVAAATVGRRMIERHGAAGAKDLLARAPTQELKRRVEETYARRAISTAGKRGALAGVFGASTGLNMGGTQGEFIEHDLSNPNLVIATGLLQGGLDTVGLGMIAKPLFTALNKIPGIQTKSMMGIVAKEAAKGFGKGAAIEGTTEAVQESLTLLARTIEDPAFAMLSEEDRASTYVRIIDAVLKGGIMGGMMGAPVGAAQGARIASMPGSDGSPPSPGEPPPVVPPTTPPAERALTEKPRDEEIKAALEEAESNAEAVVTAAELMRAGVKPSEINKAISGEARRVLQGDHASFGGALREAQVRAQDPDWGRTLAAETPMGPGADVQGGPAVTGPAVAVPERAEPLEGVVIPRSEKPGGAVGSPRRSPFELDRELLDVRGATLEEVWAAFAPLKEEKEALLDLPTTTVEQKLRLAEIEDTYNLMLVRADPRQMVESTRKDWRSELDELAEMPPVDEKDARFVAARRSMLEENLAKLDALQREVEAEAQPLRGAAEPDPLPVKGLLADAVGALEQARTAGDLVALGGERGNARQRAVARLLQKFAPEVAGVSIVNAPLDSALGRARAGVTLAHATITMDWAKLRERGVERYGSEEKAAEAGLDAALHEVLHVAFYSKLGWTSIRQAIEAGDPKTLEMKTLFDAYVAQTEGLQIDDAVTARMLQHSRLNADEFFVMAMTSPAVQQQLASMPAQSGGGKTLWTQFVEAFRKILGLPEASRSMLDEALQQGSVLLGVPQAQSVSPAAVSTAAEGGTATPVKRAKKPAASAKKPAASAKKPKAPPKRKPKRKPKAAVEAAPELEEGAKGPPLTPAELKENAAAVDGYLQHLAESQAAEANAAKRQELEAELRELNAELRALSADHIALLRQLTQDELRALGGKPFPPSLPLQAEAERQAARGNFRLKQAIAANRSKPPVFNESATRSRIDQAKEAKRLLVARRDEVQKELDTLSDVEDVGRRPRAKGEAPRAEDWDPAAKLKRDALIAPRAKGEAAAAKLTVAADKSSGYGPRTARNANAAPVTIAFALNHGTGGERATARFAGDRLVKFDGDVGRFIEAIVAKLKADPEGGTAINVAGNGIYTWARYRWDETHQWDQAKVNDAMLKVLKGVKEKHPALAKIVTGGQTGSDIAGAIAGVALGLEVDVYMPKGFKQRGLDNKDVASTAEDITALIKDEAAKLRGSEAAAAEAAAKPGSKPAVRREKRFTVAGVRAGAKDEVFVFGDNLVGRGKGGQAVIRDEPNTVGVPTKRLPSNAENAFFGKPENLAEEKGAITAAVDQLIVAREKQGKTIVMPEDGLGTGLAELEARAPEVWAHLQAELARAGLAEGAPAAEVAPPQSKPARTEFAAVDRAMEPTRPPGGNKPWLSAVRWVVGKLKTETPAQVVNWLGRNPEAKAKFLDHAEKLGLRQKRLTDTVQAMARRGTEPEALSVSTPSDSRRAESLAPRTEAEETGPNNLKATLEQVKSETEGVRAGRGGSQKRNFKPSVEEPMQVVATSSTTNRVLRYLFDDQLVGDTVKDSSVASQTTWTVPMAADPGAAGSGQATQGELVSLLALALNDGAEHKGNSPLGLRFEHPEILNKDTNKPIQIWMNARKLANLGRAMAGNAKDTVGPRSTFVALGEAFGYLQINKFVFIEGRDADNNPVFRHKSEPRGAFPTGRAVVFKPASESVKSWRSLITGAVLGHKPDKGTPLYTHLLDASVAATELAAAKEAQETATSERAKAQAEKRVDKAQEAYDDMAAQTPAALLEQLEAETGLGELDVEHRAVVSEMLADGRYAQEVLQELLEQNFSKGQEINDATGHVTPKAADPDTTAQRLPTEETANAQSRMRHGDGASGLPRTDYTIGALQATEQTLTPERAEALWQQEKTEVLIRHLAEGKNVDGITELGGLGELARGILKKIGKLQVVVLGTEGLAQLTERLVAERGPASAGIEATLANLQAEIAKVGKNSIRGRQLRDGYKNERGRWIEGEGELYRRVIAKRMLEDVRAAVADGSPAWVIYGQHSDQAFANVPVIFIDETRLKGRGKRIRAMGHELGHAVMRAEVEAEGRSATRSELRAQFLREVPWASKESAEVQTELFSEWFAEMFAEYQLRDQGKLPVHLPREVTHSKGVQAFLGKLNAALRKLWAQLRRQPEFNDTFSAFMRALASRRAEQTPRARPPGRHLPDSRALVPVFGKQPQQAVPTRDGLHLVTDVRQNVREGGYGLSKEALIELSSVSWGLSKAQDKLPRYSNLAGVEKLRRTQAGKVLEASGEMSSSVLKSLWRIAGQSTSATLDALGLGSMRSEFFANSGEAMNGRAAIPVRLRQLRGEAAKEVGEIAELLGFAKVKSWYKLGLAHYDRTTADAKLVEDVLVDLAINGDENAAYARLPEGYQEGLARLREFLDNTLDYGERVGGLQIVRRQGYIPISIDHHLARVDEAGFLPVWREILQEVADARAKEKDGSKAHTVSEAEAIRAWENLQGEDGALDNFGLAGDARYANYGPALVHARQRGLTREQWARLKPWVQRDVLSTVLLYSQRLQRRAEYQRRAGYAAKDFYVTNAEKAEHRRRINAATDDVEKAALLKEFGALKDQRREARKAKQAELEALGINKDMLMQPTVKWQILMRKKVMNGELSPGDYQHVATRILPALMGTLGQHLHPRYRRLARGLQVYQSITLLTMGWFASIMDAGLLAWKVGDMRIMAQSVIEAMRAPKNMTRADRREMYELHGVLNSAQMDHYLNSGAMQQQFAMGRVNTISEVFFRANFMHQWTEGLRLIGAIAAQKYMIKHADQAKAGNVESGELLSHLGVTADQVLAVANRLDGTLNMNPALGTSAKITGALNTFVDQAILRPDAAVRPWWGSHPIGSIFFFLKSFMWAFQEIVLKSVWRTSKRQGEGKVTRTALHGFLNAAPLLAFIIPLTVLGFELRRQLAGTEDEDWFEQLDEKGPMGYALEIAKRAGLLGAMELGTHDVAGDMQRGNFPLAAVSGPTGEMFFEGVFGGGLADPTWWAGRTPVVASVPVLRAKWGEALGGG